MKNEKLGRGIVAVFLAWIMITSVLASLSTASMSPGTLDATLDPCESITVTKTVTIPTYHPKADVLFSFDLTGSMWPILDTAKTNAGDIMTTLDALGVDINYGVASYMDYPDVYSSCGYSNSYGSAGWGDYAYSLDQPITSIQTAVTTAINGLPMGNGLDIPEAYTRIMYESYADSNIAWRTGAEKILVNFGDTVPHDCDLNEGVPGKTGTWTTGGDPGRDEIMGTSDDLDLQTVLANMATNGIILLECHTSGYADDYWMYWTGITGGDLYLTSSSTLVTDVVNAVTATLTIAKVYNLHLEVITPGYDSWLESVVPASYAELDPGDIVTFDETIHVPLGTAPGVYTFTVSAVDDDGVSYGDQLVTITVPAKINAYVDIKPGSYPNSINPKSKGNVPVAILTTDDFDASNVDPATIVFLDATPVQWAMDDVDFDGDLDMIFHFKIQELDFTLLVDEGGEYPYAYITGETTDGQPIEGKDTVRLVHPLKMLFENFFARILQIIERIVQTFT